jgi:hypothetical protein
VSVQLIYFDFFCAIKVNFIQGVLQGQFSLAGQSTDELESHLQQAGIQPLERGDGKESYAYLLNMPITSLCENKVRPFCFICSIHPAHGKDSILPPSNTGNLPL